MFDKGWTEEDRWARLKRPKFVRPKFDTLSSDDKQTILADFNPNTFLGARNLAVLSIFLDTGVRLEELVNIQTQRVRLDAGYVEVYANKTDEWRIIPMSPETIVLPLLSLKLFPHSASRDAYGARRRGSHLTAGRAGSSPS